MVDIKDLVTGQLMNWRKKGKRYAIPVIVIGTNFDAGKVMVTELNGNKWHRIPVEQLEQVPKVKQS